MDYGEKPKVILIVGPNASGKSGLAVKLAKKINGEIISADSRQVYKDLDVATGKITKKEMGGIPHFLLDVADPQKQFTVVDFKTLAQKAIKNIVGRGKTPIITGVTGFWINALIYDLNIPMVPPNPKLRRLLEKKSPVELLTILEKLDPERAKTVEQKNPRRIIRALEIAKTLGEVPGISKKTPYQTLWLGIKLPKKGLKKKIRTRVLKRIQGGMIAEAKSLKKQGLPWKRFYELGLEYRFLADYLRGKIKKVNMIENIRKADEDYARRQMTWFKKNPEINWLKNQKEAELLTKKFLKSLKNPGNRLK